MLRGAALFLGLFLLSGSAGATEVVTVELPGLLGAFPSVLAGETRTVTVQLPINPTVIHSVRLRLAGDSIIGALHCEEEVNGGILIWDEEWPYSFSATIDDPISGYWEAGGLTPMTYSAPFEINDTFVGFEAPTWDFLLDGEAVLRLDGHPTIGNSTGCGWLGGPAQATITEAQLVVTGEFGVPTEGATWGAIKALYKDAF